MSTANVLVVDDEPDIRELVEIVLGRMGLHISSAANLDEARQRLREQTFDLCITDMRLPDGTGIELVHEIQQRCPYTPVAVITAYGNAEVAVESLKAGAFDFVAKPVDVPALRKLVDSALKLREHNTDNPENASPPSSDASTELLGTHHSIQALRNLIERLARSQAPVHISGESGTGKELVARQIHLRGPRARAPFVAINCGAVPNELMESEFFGHIKGSFTGAHRDKAGLFQAAEGGTLFLDEVAELPLHMQVKLLRALQERRVRPVGASQEIAVNVRIISATHENLAQRVSSGQFRQDLFYRLDVIAVHTPALRERPEDIPLLTEQILHRIAARTGYADVPAVDAATLQALQAYSFPGNVRELENILERSLTLCDGITIYPADLQLRSDFAIAPPPLLTLTDPAQTPAEVEQIEARAAQKLGISTRALRERLRKLGIQIPASPP